MGALVFYGERAEISSNPPPEARRNETEMKNRLAAIAALGIIAGSNLVACGSDGGNDEDFVRGLCEASTELRTGVEKAVKDGSTSTDPNKVVELLVVPIDAFVEAFDDLKPPKDLKDWHEESTKQLKATAETFRSEKKLTALASFNDSPVPSPPDAARARLETAAASVPECNGVAFLKPN